MPNFGVKADAIPGRLNQLAFLIAKPGMYYGQCSELCGIDHGYMPITIETILYEQFVKQIGEITKKAVQKEWI